ncbi:MAG: hypothetical protein RL753_689, partial [Bacteroidota bacterium]
MLEIKHIPLLARDKKVKSGYNRT